MRCNNELSSTKRSGHADAIFRDATQQMRRRGIFAPEMIVGQVGSRRSPAPAPRRAHAAGGNPGRLRLLLVSLLLLRE